MPTGLQTSKSPNAAVREAASSPATAGCLRDLRSLSVYDAEEVTRAPFASRYAEPTRLRDDAIAVAV